MTDDRNRIVMHSVEISLLDVRTQNGGYYQVVGRGETPEEAMAAAEKEALKMHEQTARLVGTEVIIDV